MSKIIRKLITVSCFLFVTIFGVAQKENFTMSVSKNPVPIGERFSLKLELQNIKAQLPQISLPASFRYVGGPMSSQYTSISNGEVTSTISMTYFYVATKEGNYNIPSVKVTSGNVTYESNKINLTVARGSMPKANQPNQNNNNQRVTPPQQSSDFFAKLTVSKSNVYKGEPLVATYKIYSRYRYFDFVQQPKFTQPEGFNVQEIQDQSGKQKIEVINGVQYLVTTISKMVLIPQKSGQLIIPSINMQCVVGQGGFFGRQERVSANSGAVTVNAKALPSGKPTSFTGAVGNFKFTVNQSKKEIKLNEGIDLKLKLSGSGNIQWATLPELSFPEGLEVYDPKTSESSSVTAGGINGNKSANYLIIPRKAGEYKLPPIEFSYFDIASKRYKTIESDSLIFYVKGENGVIPQNTIAIAPKQSIKVGDDEIHYIKTGSQDYQEKGDSFFGSKLYWLLIIFPTLLLAGFTSYRKYQEKNTSNPDIVKNKKASKVAQKRLAKARTNLNSGNEFYEELFKAIYGYLGDKLSIDTSLMNKTIIKEKLTSLSIENAQINELIKVLDECEMARFAPGQATAPEALLSKTEELINELDKALKSASY